jgi:UDP-4-amino-4,6-dideoxy-N-acetyl-beta-L-altrosamine transaminase
MIPYGRQDITVEDIDAVVKTLTSDFLTQGPAVPKFESLVLEKTGAKYGVGVNSATSALHLACMALDLSSDDWLWTSPVTFVASANCGLYCGAKIDFIDIDPDTYNVCPKALEDKLVKAETDGCLPKILVAVHLCGQSCDMIALSKLAKKYGFKIIEDASHAIGGSYLDKPIGSCIYSDITIFSFHPVKIITTGEGGMCVTNSPFLAESMVLNRSHGITRDPQRMSKEPDGPWYYEQIGLGLNYRMTDIQAALGCSQIERLDAYVESRHKINSLYSQVLSKLPIKLPFQDPNCYSAFHLYVIRLNLSEINSSHRQVFESLREAGIGVNLHYIPVYRQPFYQKMGYIPSNFPNSESYYQEAISLPMYPALTLREINHIHDSLEKALNG